MCASKCGVCLSVMCVSVFDVGSVCGVCLCVVWGLCVVCVCVWYVSVCGVGLCVGEEGGHPSASGLSIQPPTPEGTTPPTLGSPPCRMSPLNSSPQASSGGHPALS